MLMITGFVLFHAEESFDLEKNPFLVIIKNFEVTTLK